MTNKVLPKTALISVSNKSGVVTFAKLLQKNGVKIFATGGTASALKDAGIKVSKVSSISRFPEIFGGRVKTLSPYISGGILGQRDKDKAEAKKNNITWIDLVVCNLYPFSGVAKNTNSTMDEKIENIDEKRLYFILNTLNRINANLIRNKLLLKVLPLKV